jgi:hypothetical protein
MTLCKIQKEASIANSAILASWNCWNNRTRLRCKSWGIDSRVNILINDMWKYYHFTSYAFEEIHEVCRHIIDIIERGFNWCTAYIVTQRTVSWRIAFVFGNCIRLDLLWSFNRLVWNFYVLLRFLWFLGNCFSWLCLLYWITLVFALLLSPLGIIWKFSL